MSDICYICGDELSNKYIHDLDCSHRFHYDCIVKSFKASNNRKCPICRNDSSILPMVNCCNGPYINIHYDYSSSLKDIDNLNNYNHVKCDHVISRGKNKGNLCNKRCVIGFYKCINHL